jgi:hypothetical protein
VKATAPHLVDKQVTSDLAFDIAHSAPHNPGPIDRLGKEELVNPGLIHG